MVQETPKLEFARIFTNFREEYLEIVPNYWKWKDHIENMNKDSQEKYRLFFKHNPDFSLIFEYLSASYKKLGDTEKAQYYYHFIDT